MRTDDLDYDLPPALIAQTPAEPRDSARLLVYDRATGAIRHRRFGDLLDELRADDLVVLNDTRVLPVRVRARRASGGAVEVLLLEPEPEGRWQALARPARRLRDGETLHGGRARDHDRAPPRRRPAACSPTRRGAWPRRAGPGPIAQALDRIGEMPLPPYIHTPLHDPGRYQTVYARHPGSAAAPTAGLHFTPALLERLRSRHRGGRGDPGRRARHVPARDRRRPRRPSPAQRGLLRPGRHGRRGGRRPQRAGAGSSPSAPPPCACSRRCGAGRSAARCAGRTRLMITPGRPFAATGALVTNFHLPRSTLLALVMAFAGVDQAARRLPHGDRRAVPLLQLRRCDAAAMQRPLPRHRHRRRRPRRRARNGARRSAHARVHAGGDEGEREGDAAGGAATTSARRSCSANTYHLISAPARTASPRLAGCTGSAAGTARS